MTAPNEIGPVGSSDAAATIDAAVPAERTPRFQGILNATSLYAVVAIGSVIGSILRALASLAVQAVGAAGLPLATLFVNVTGSFVIGFYAALTGPDGRLFAGPRQRQFVMTGICGGYTTFSMFSLETLNLLRADELALASLNISVSVVAWLIAVWIGYALAMTLNRAKWVNDVDREGSASGSEQEQK